MPKHYLVCGACMSIFYRMFLLLYFVFQGLLTSKMIFIYFFHIFMIQFNLIMFPLYCDVIIFVSFVSGVRDWK